VLLKANKSNDVDTNPIFEKFLIMITKKIIAALILLCGQLSVYGKAFIKNVDGRNPAVRIFISPQLAHPDLYAQEGLKMFDAQAERFNLAKVCEVRIFIDLSRKASVGFFFKSTDIVERKPLGQIELAVPLAPTED
jgi:hypothetical protein